MNYAQLEFPDAFYEDDFGRPVSIEDTTLLQYYGNISLMKGGSTLVVFTVLDGQLFISPSSVDLNTVNSDTWVIYDKLPNNCQSC